MVIVNDDIKKIKIKIWKRYFFSVLLFKNIKNVAKKKRINGILFPEKIIDVVDIKNNRVSTGILIFKSCLTPKII